MDYTAQYTILIEGATWGRKDISFDADTNEEAVEIALQKEDEYSSKHEELLLDYIYDEDGNIIKEGR